MTRRFPLAAAAALALASCATTAPAPAKPQPRTVGLTLDEAKEIVAEFEAKQLALSRENPLRDPRSADDVLAILKSDQIALFPAGVAWAAAYKDDVKAESLRAQIELAWGEALQILADVFVDASGQMKTALRSMEVRAATGELNEKLQARYEKLKEVSAKSDLVAEALTRLAAEHVGAGARLAQDLIKKLPDDYVGYRVAADYYRLRSEWDVFDTMVAKIEAKNPDSNGLVFLRGAALLHRDQEPARAAELFRKALEKDPQFVRAQAQLVLSGQSVKDTFREYQALRALNPNHQIVVWAGEAITTAFEAQRPRDD